MYVPGAGLVVPTSCPWYWSAPIMTVAVWSCAKTVDNKDVVAMVAINRVRNSVAEYFAIFDNFSFSGMFMPVYPFCMLGYLSYLIIWAFHRVVFGCWC